MYLVKTLKKRQDFLKTMKDGYKIMCPSFILFFMPKNHAKPTIEIGYTVSSKVGNAVVRNKVKRRLRNLALNAIKENPDTINIPTNFNSLIICFVAKHCCSQSEYANMQKEFFNALKNYKKHN
jgi:ribonuclease P protein component